MGHAPMLIDSNNKPYVELVQMLCGKQMVPNPSYPFPSLEVANRFAENQMMTALVYDKDGVLRYEYQRDQTNRTTVWTKAPGGWSLKQ